MGGRGNSSKGSYSGGSFAAAPASLSPVEHQLNDVFDHLTPIERQIVTGFTNDQLEAIGLAPRLAFKLAAQGLDNDQIARLIAQANQNYTSYVVINNDTKGVIGEYPFLEMTGRQWNIVMQPIDQALADPNNPINDFIATPDESVTFGLSEPTLRWVKDGKVVSVYVDGMPLDEYTKSMGLEITMPKGEAVTGKRLARIFRDYKLYDTMPSSEIKIDVLQQDDKAKLIWDGAGVISRTLLKDLAIVKGITGTPLDELLDEVDRGGRVEFTIVNASGQYKGHAIVSDSLTSDFLIPDDAKTDIKLTTGQTFVGINFVHGKSTMNLDVQSMVNLNPFFNPANLSNYLEAEGDLYLQSLDNGHMTDVLQRIQPDASVADLERWTLANYYARGGDPMWFKTPISSTINQHLDQLEFKTKGRISMPIPGSRYYVMPDAVGQAANLDVSVPRGGIRIDKTTNTAWVNAEDWVGLQDSSNGQGIRDILGGADNDDALWLHPFHDEKTGKDTILVWRSPNEPGDYVLLQPSSNSNVSSFQTTSGPITFRSADSSNLPDRRDRSPRNYLGSVPEADGSNLGKGQPYGIGIMDLAIRQEAINAPVLGTYVNALMVQKLVFGKTPDTLPAPLEDIVDASAKTGADLRAVKSWIFEQSAMLSDFGVGVPESFQRRVAIDWNDKQTKKPPVTEGHWIDQLLGVVDTHIETTKKRGDELRSNAQAPAALFESVFENPEDVYLGAAYNKTYGAALKKFESAYAGDSKKAHDAAQLAAEAFLDRFPETKQRAILRGSLISSQMSERNASDAASWLQGHVGPDGRQRNSVAHKTLDALTEVGILGTLNDNIHTDEDTGRSYLQAVVTSPPERGDERLTMITLQDTTRFELERSGVPYERAQRSALSTAQKRVEHNTRIRAYDDLDLTILHQTVNGQRRAVAYTDSGSAIGMLPPNHPEILDGSHLVIKHAISQGNNLRIIVK